MEQREYDDHKILFVMNETGDEAEQAIRYLRALQIPEGYAAEVVACEPGTSVAANYNAIQRVSNARYKTPFVRSWSVPSTPRRPMSG